MQILKSGDKKISVINDYIFKKLDGNVLTCPKTEFARAREGRR